VLSYSRLKNYLEVGVMSDFLWILTVLAVVCYVIWVIAKKMIYSIFYVATKAMHDAKKDD